MLIAKNAVYVLALEFHWITCKNSLKTTSMIFIPAHYYKFFIANTFPPIKVQNFCLCRDKTAAFRQGLFLQIQTMQALQSLQQRHNSLKSELSEAQQVLQFLDSLEKRLNSDKEKHEQVNDDDFERDQKILDKLQIGYDFDKQNAAGHVSKSKIGWMIAFTALSFIFFRRAFGGNGLSLDI